MKSNQKSRLILISLNSTIITLSTPDRCAFWFTQTLHNLELLLKFK